MIFLRAWYRDFLRDLQQLLESGIPVVEALSMLASERSGLRGELAARLQVRVKAGATLGEAWAVEPRIPEAHAKLVAAGEKAGKIPVVLAGILRQLERQKELFDQTKAQSSYYLLCLVFAVVGLPLPLVLTGHALKYLAIQVGFFGCIGAVIWLARRGVALPWVSSIALELEAGRTFQILAMFIESGVSIGQALPWTASTVRRPALAEALRDAETRLRAGSSLREAFTGAAVFRGRESWLGRIAVAEQAGAFDSILRDLGEGIERAAWQRVTRVAKVLPFVILPIVGAMVLYQALNVFGKMYGGL